MLEITYGETKNGAVAADLVEVLREMNLDGTLYLGYPILATADDSVTADALLVSAQHGLVAFHFARIPPTMTDVRQWEDLRDDLDRLYVAMDNHLSRHDSLRDRRRLALDINTVAVFPLTPKMPAEFPSDQGFLAVGLSEIPKTIRSFLLLNEHFLRPLHAALQRVTTIKPRKRRQTVTSLHSRGGILKQIEQGIANLDQWQKRAAIESPAGPQRVRGLAGSGKTIVLALKAAYLHTQHPDWVIAVTFQTRSLYQQLEDLIRRFTFEHLNDEPNWENLRIRHAWGGRDRLGVYTEIADHCGVAPRNFIYGRSRFGRSDAFGGVCAELLDATVNTNIRPLYDAVLIDEAQDLPTPFYRLVYRFTNEPKRIVWAYDDLQKLSESSMPTLSELFGEGETGDPLVSLVNSEGDPQQDIILPRCYRNPPWALALAHGLGLGIYRKEGLVQYFDIPTLWTEIGYRLVGGELAPGKSVELDRGSTSFPEYFNLLDRNDSVVARTFSSPVEQAAWIAENIRRNLTEDQLEHDDILVILPDAYRAKSHAAAIMQALSRFRIDSHIAGVTTSRDELFGPKSIALANIHRSKGNEAAMVYIMNAQTCLSGPELISLRNTLFTAITRSRAWIRICGWGPNMEELEKEIKAIISNGYRLKFSIPTSDELSRMRQIHRELTASERQKVQQMERTLRELIVALDKGDLDIENLPADVRGAMVKYFASQELRQDDSEADAG